MANRLAHCQIQNQQTRYNNSNSKNKSNISDLYNLNSNYQINKHQLPINSLKTTHINTSNIKSFSTPINVATVTTPSISTTNNDIRNSHPHANHVALSTTHFLRTSEL